MEQQQDCSTQPDPHQPNPMIMSIVDATYADTRTRKIEDEVNLKIKMYITDRINESIALVTQGIERIKIFDNTEFGASLTQHSLDVGQVLSGGGSGNNSFESPSFSSVYNTPPREEQPTEELASTAFTASHPQASASQQHSTFGQHSDPVPNDPQPSTSFGEPFQLPTMSQHQSNAFVDNTQINTMSHQQQLLPSSSNYLEQSTSSTYGQQHAGIVQQQQAGPSSQQNHPVQQANSIEEIIANYKRTPIDFNNEDSGFYDFAAQSAHQSTSYYEQVYTQQAFMQQSQDFPFSSGQLADYATQQSSDHHFGYTTAPSDYHHHQSMAPLAQYQNVNRESVPANLNPPNVFNTQRTFQSTDILSQAMESSQLTGYLDANEEKPVISTQVQHHHSQMVNQTAQSLQSWHSYQQQNAEQSFASQPIVSNKQQTLKRNLNPIENIESSAKRARTNSINQKQPQPTTFFVIKPNKSLVQVENFNGQMNVQPQPQQHQPTNAQSARASSSVMTSAINQSGVQCKAEGNGALRYGTLSLYCIVDGCPKVFITRSMLDTHLRTEHGKGAFWCLGCTETFDTKHKLSQHIKFQHDKQTEWPCIKCTNKYTTQTDLSWHFFSEHHRGQFKCFTEDCAFTGMNRQSVIVHYDQHEHNHCRYKDCLKEYSTKDGLKAHIVLVHHKQKPAHICPIRTCGKAFKNKSDLIRHKRTHRDARPYLCKWPDCKYHGAKDRATCLNHIRVMHFGMPIKKNERSAAELVMDPRPYMEVVKELLF